ncbi:hypothetical protein [Dyadobacter psychrotolerans]|uniref:Uncharacterized protein n=1 Tax=Dyadobacter psychrotolerans TaxID=2541721 RepID=A0A4R5DUA8_9BACT|nr:hypothetical protein [Dyadobacter psychrotolerans]TDE18039.1 hypothetical protein E0F88_00340 [Dyadobacter psychrotolerans]
MYDFKDGFQTSANHIGFSGILQQFALRRAETTCFAVAGQMYQSITFLFYPLPRSNRNLPLRDLAAPRRPRRVGRAAQASPAGPPWPWSGGPCPPNHSELVGGRLMK